MDGSIRFPEKVSRIGKKSRKSGYKPRTPLGAWLMKMRRRAVAKGLATWSTDDVLAEMKRRRGRSAHDNS